MLGEQGSVGSSVGRHESGGGVGSAVEARDGSGVDGQRLSGAHGRPRHSASGEVGFPVLERDVSLVDGNQRVGAPLWHHTVREPWQLPRGST